MENTINNLPPDPDDDKERNDTAGPDDDTIGENTELTPLAKDILKDKDQKVEAKNNQENKDFSGEDG
ncbi:hypothetical protein [Rubrolithibacter danxiaensis]|uniref:hypothetical protein n=1 Tax=Rubrolithibacter danxiaensis TaxID=3390805 RepID=UPI003BF8C3A5